jgi:hypothetical protein
MTAEEKAARAIFAAGKDGAYQKAAEASPRLAEAIERLWLRSGREQWSYCRYLCELNRLVAEN